MLYGGVRRDNTIRSEVERGNAVFGASAATFSPSVIETFGTLGLDFVWVDFEHSGPSPYDSTVMENLTRAADVAGTELFTRLPSAEPHLIRKVLDAGARTLLLPRVETAEEVRRAVDATKFTYDGSPGDRGIGIGRSSTWGADLDEHAAREDDEVMLGVMIENRTAVENIEEILSVPELRFVFIGPADLSVSFGRPMEKSNADVQSTINRVEAAVRDSSVALGGIRNSPEEATEAIESGYQILRIGGDISAARSVLGDRLNDIRPE